MTMSGEVNNDRVERSDECSSQTESVSRLELCAIAGELGRLVGAHLAESLPNRGSTQNRLADDRREQSAILTRS